MITALACLATAILLAVSIPRVHGWRAAKSDFKPCSPPWWENVLYWGCGDGPPPDHPPVEPVNTWSNLAYAAAGWIIYERVQTPESLVFAIAMNLLAIGSGIFHAVPGRLTNGFDHAGMYAVFGALSTHNAAFDFGPLWIAMALAGFAAAALFSFFIKANLNAMMGLFLWFSLISTVNTLACVAMLLFGMAMVFWQLDKKKRFTHRLGHGLWHVLTAAAISVMFLAGV